jgi:hypothetical protein
LTVDVVATALVYVALGLGKRGRLWGVGVAALAVAVAPRLVVGRSGFVRFLLGLLSVVLIVKFYDLTIGAGRAGASRPRVAAFLMFLVNNFALVYRKLDAEPRPPRGADVRRMALGVLGLAGGAVVAAWVFGADWKARPLAAEHPAKVLAVFGVLMPLDALGVAAWRLAGGRGRQLMRHPYLAATPADFWRRYNRPAGHFLHENVFRRAGGRWSPRWATLATFLVSAAVHEYLFSVVLGQVEGFQTAFFLIQGVAVAATLKVRPRGWRAAVGVAVTLAFNLLTSLLFFASVGGLVPFYASDRPAWLRPRGD